ncbi:MAG: OmpA family protein [Prevotella sp.]|nr:OmpA family protein [Prevotella sp.]
MKKLLIVLAFAGVSMASMAQDDPTLKYSVATNSFWSNWFIQVGYNYNVFYSNEELASGIDNDKSPFKSFRNSHGAAIAIGKWFTPGLGLRTKLQGVWGKTVGPQYPGQPTANYTKNSYYKTKFWSLNEHILFNLSNMFCGYNPNRVWSFIPFVGGGITRNMSSNDYAMQLSAGLLNQFRLSNRVALNLEVGWNRQEPDADGEWQVGSQRGWKNKDNYLYGEVGLTFNLGRKASWDKVPDVEGIKADFLSRIDALNAQLNDANAENARLKNLLANQKAAETPKAVKEFVAVPVTVYFYLNKTNNGPSYAADLVDVKNLVNVAKEKNTGLLVTGYADSATGKADHNQWLSEKRAEQVANEIVKMGVSRDKIETAAKGGVAILSPINLDRRATVELKK